MASSPQVNEANRYARQVVKGQIPACHWLKQAAQRHLNDLERAKTRAFPYKLDRSKAEKACQGIEMFPHVKGKWSGTLIKLEPWQKLIVVSLFGWVRKSDNLRRFRNAYIEVPRKNAKSTLAAAIALMMAFLDDEGGAEVYSAATTRDQARIVWQAAKQMVSKSPQFQSEIGVAPHAHSISQDESGSKFEPLSAEGANLDGLNVHMAVLDEFHAHKQRLVFDALDTGMGARSQPLLLAITTAGYNQAGVCYQYRSYVTKILDGLVEDETVFGAIYGIDDADQDHIFEEWTWKKANPNYGVSVNPEDLQALARRAKASPSDQVAFLTKRLNVWTNASQAWIPAHMWQDCGHEPIALEDFRGQRCWMGLDLASRVDVASLMLVFQDGDNYYCIGRYYLPEDAVAERANLTTNHYWGWSQEGRMVLTPGNVIDFNTIKEDIRSLAPMFDLRSIAYDPWQATQLATELLDEGYPMVEIRHTVANFSEPMKEIEAMVRDRKFGHGGCPILSWMASNVVCHYDNKDNVYPRKEFQENKIDGIVALIMAMNRAMHDQGETQPTSIYESRGIISV